VSQSRQGFALAALAFLAGAVPAAGQSSETAAPSAEDSKSGWSFTIAPYLWATSLDGNATVGGTKSDIDIPFKDILKDLSFGGMVLVDVERGPFGLGINGMFARVSPDSENNGVKIDTTSDTLQLEVAPYYRLVDWAYGVSSSGQPLRLVIEPEAGFRFTYLRAELNVRHGGPTVDESENWVDPLIGSRFGIDLADNWNLTAEGNVGGFGVGSDLAWNVQGFVGYKTSLFGLPTTLAAGYRALHQDYDHNDFKWDVTMYGPVIGAVLRF
jgi:hypothetical protein